MFESCEPGAGGNGCAFHASDDLRAGQSDVDQIDLCKRYWFFQRVNGQLFANVVGVVAEHGFPRQVQSAGRVLEFDANLATGNTIGGAGGRGKAEGEIGGAAGDVTARVVAGGSAA